jgi:hypothetical protein
MSDNPSNLLGLAALGSASGVLAEETVASFLQRKERELMQKAAAIRGMLAPVDRELAQVRKALEALGLKAPGTHTSLADLVQRSPTDEMISALKTIPSLPQTNSNATVSGNLLTGTAYDLGLVGLTIKQMILLALRDHFRGDGATPVNLRDYIKTVYGRDIDRNSISPQLARLREQGADVQVDGGKWKVSRVAKWYDNPSSWTDLDKDEPPESGVVRSQLSDAVTAEDAISEIKKLLSKE